MNLMKAKHQRLILVVIALAGLLAAGLLASYALRTQASFFYVPTEMVDQPPEIGRAVRLGGMVQVGSLRIMEDGITIAFDVGDGDAIMPVRFAGIVPSLFVEGSGVVAEGRLDADGTFVADNLLAKHDENYIPRELEEMNQHQTRDLVAGAEMGNANRVMNNQAAPQ